LNHPSLPTRRSSDLGPLLDEAVDVFLLREVDVDAIAFAHLADPLERIVEVLRSAPADEDLHAFAGQQDRNGATNPGGAAGDDRLDRKSTRLNSSHVK